MKVLYFSLVSWTWIKQRPQFICEMLAAQGLTLDFLYLKPILKGKLISLTSERLSVIGKNVLPFAMKINLIERINRYYISLCLKHRQYDIIILTHPRQLGFIPLKLRNTLPIIYDCMDNMPFFYKGKSLETVKHQERLLCAEAQSIIASSDYIKQRLTRDYEIADSKIAVIKNAVDSNFKNMPLMPIKLESPNLAYIGTISEWLDWELLCRFAARHTEITIYLIGPREKAPPPALPSNLVIYGTVEHQLVKSCIANANVMLLPFITNELIRGINPVKMYEYIAMNKFIVSAWWNELNEFSSNRGVAFYRSPEEFEQLVMQSLKLAESAPAAGLNENFVQANCWENRIVEYKKVLYCSKELKNNG
jgi:glycosyltransferase involved in cell wall biosynthesis